MRLTAPVLARFDDRTQRSYDDPLVRSWVDGMLAGGYAGVQAATFDYVVDWRTDRLRTPLFFKRMMDGPAPTELPSVPSLIAQDTAMAQTVAFCQAVQRPLDLIAIDDTAKWDNPHPRSLLRATLSHPTDEPAALQPVTLHDLRQTLRDLRGSNPAKNPKPLTYATSSLESYLAPTDTPWPGDADLVLYHQETMDPLAILEMKKHTEISERSADGIRFAEQGFERYKDKDFRKYNSLAILSDQLVAHKTLPVYTLYYTAYKPTRTGTTQSMALERLHHNGTRVQHGAKLFSQEVPQNATPHRVAHKVLAEIRKDLQNRPPNQPSLSSRAVERPAMGRA